MGTIYAPTATTGAWREAVATWTETVQLLRGIVQNCAGKTAESRGKASNLWGEASGKAGKPAAKREMAETFRKQAVFRVGRTDRAVRTSLRPSPAIAAHDSGVSSDSACATPSTPSSMKPVFHPLANVAGSYGLGIAVS